MAGDLAALPGSPLGPQRRLRLVRAGNLTIATTRRWRTCTGTVRGHPAEGPGAGGVVAVEYGPRFRPTDWRRQAVELTLNPSVRWRIEAPRGLERLRADLRETQFLGLEVQHAARQVEVMLPRPAGPVLVRFAGGASDVTIYRPTGTVARVRVVGGASRLSFDEQFYKAVAARPPGRRPASSRPPTATRSTSPAACRTWWSIP
jgi:hypothetical protein